MFFSDKCKGQKKNLCSQRDWSSENYTKGDFSLKYLRICKKNKVRIWHFKKGTGKVFFMLLKVMGLILN